MIKGAMQPLSWLQEIYCHPMFFAIFGNGMNLFMLPFGPLSQYNGCIVIHIENNENQKKFNTQPPFLPNNFFFGPIQCMLQCVIG
jgi:hypothetical protein